MAQARPRVTHYTEQADDDKTVCGQDRLYVINVTADRLMYHPVSRRMMRAPERRRLALGSVTCKRCRKLKGAA